MKHAYDFKLNHFNVDRINDTIPPECPRELTHAWLHYQNAERELSAGNIPQAIHELSLAYRIMFVVA